MVRGVSTSLQFPFAQFPTAGATAPALSIKLLSAVEHLETAGLHVVAITGDGAAPNRKCFKMLSSNIEGVLHKALNPYSARPSSIHLFSDVPHLLKTTRNFFYQSYPGASARAMRVRQQMWLLHLQFNDYDITWKHVRQLYERLSYKSSHSGLQLLPKIKAELIDLTSYSKCELILPLRFGIRYTLAKM